MYSHPEAKGKSKSLQNMLRSKALEIYYVLFVGRMW